MATLEDTAASLTMDEIPVKLRCAACNKLASNAFRMPCCDQSICETCQSSLPQACPVCLHEPVKGDDCRPNKALRTTVKVFLRKKGIEREAARKKELVDKAATFPATSAMNLVDMSSVAKQPEVSIRSTTRDIDNNLAGSGPQNGSDVTQSMNSIDNAVVPKISPLEEHKDIPRPSIEAASGEAQKEGSQGVAVGMNGVQEKVDQNLLDMDHEQKNDQRLDQNQQWGLNSGAGSLMNNGGFGFDTTNGGFPNMGFNGTADFTQMMQFMPNGMQPNNMGAFPNMMGIPGMGMDPMAMSQGMYGGFGAQGMGINGMNVDMGFNAGQGAFGGFNGQPAAWNAGQDKFNQNSYGAQSTGMVGDFGPSAGYAGYNVLQHQGNFNQMHHQYQNNDFQSGYNSQGFYNRGRGRGRGSQNAGRGRGGFNQVNAGNQANYEPFHHQIPQHTTKQDPPLPSQSMEAPKSQQGQQGQPRATEGPQTLNDEQINIEKLADEQLAKELDPGDADDIAATSSANPPANPIIDENSVAHTQHADGVADPSEKKQKELLPESEKEEKPAPVESAELSDVKEPGTAQIQSASSTAMLPPPQNAPVGPAALYPNDHSQDYSLRGRGTGRGFFRGNSDYRGGMRGRGSTFHSNSTVAHPLSVQSSPAIDLPIHPPAEPKGLGVEGAPKAPRALREGLPNTGMRGGRGISIVGRAATNLPARPSGPTRSRSPSPTRSRSPSRHQPHRHRSYRHRSTSSSNDSERERRRDRHRRNSRKYEDAENGENQESNESRARERSADESSKKSSHRSHREHAKDKDAGRSSHRSHRSHRERSREREEESHSRRKRSRSAVDEVKRGKRLDGIEPLSPTESRRQDNQDESSQSSRKRQDKDDEDRHRERKRSRRERSLLAEDKGKNSRSRHPKHDDTNIRSSRDQTSKTQERLIENSKPPTPTKPEMDHHTLEREARNRERLQKELQRREAMEGKGSASKSRDSKVDSRTGTAARRVSYKYEDEESNEARASRVEKEREAGRWR